MQMTIYNVKCKTYQITYLIVMRLLQNLDIKQSNKAEIVKHKEKLNSISNANDINVDNDKGDNYGDEQNLIMNNYPKINMYT